MSKSKVRINPATIRPVQAEPVQNVSTSVFSSVFSDEEIRVRAYQIYESSDRTNKHADEDWSQAQTELMEMLGGK
jgi:Protein of unknown function (DUF2934)